WGLQLLVGKAHRRERDAKRPAMRSVEPDRLMGAVERERGNADREAVAASRFHLIRPHHDPRGCRQRRATGVFEALAGGEHRLLADDTIAAHLFYLSAAVGNSPMPVAQLDGFLAAVLDADMVGPDVMVLDRRGLVLQVERLDRDLDRSGGF